MNKLPIEETQNIICLEADINYTIFHLSEGKRIISSFTLKKFQERPEFQHYLRVNRGTLINPNFIKSFNLIGKYKEVILENGKVLTISRRREDVVQCLSNFKVS